MRFLSFIFRGLCDYFIPQILILAVFVFYFFIVPDYWFLCSFFTFIIGSGIYLFIGYKNK